MKEVDTTSTTLEIINIADWAFPLSRSFIAHLAGETFAMDRQAENYQFNQDRIHHRW